MKSPDSHNSPQVRPSQKRSTRTAMRVLRIAGLGIVGTAAFIILLLTAATLYLTPERLTPLVTKYAEEYLNAEVRASDIKFTIWSTFPHFTVEIDSIDIISKNFNQLSPEIKNSLPQGGDSLANITGFSGGINLMSLLKNKIKLSKVTIDGLKVNLVSLNDTLNNYNIIQEESSLNTKIPEFSARDIILKNNGEIRYFSASSEVEGKLLLKTFQIKENRKSKNNYSLNLEALISASYQNKRLLTKFPVGINGLLKLAFKPFGVKFSNFGINLGNLTSSLNLGLNLEQNSIDHLEYHIDPVDLVTFLAYLPQDFFPEISTLKSNISVKLSARLTEPYKYSTDSLPSFEIDIIVPPASLNYNLAGVGDFSLKNLVMKGKVDFNGKNPSQSTATLENLSFDAPGTHLQISGLLTNLLGNPEVEAIVKGNADIARLLPIFPSAKNIKINGRADINTSVKFDIDDAEKYGLAAILLAGKVGLHDFSYSLPKSDLLLSGPALQLNLTSEKGNFSTTGNISSLAVNGKKMNGKVENINLNFTGKTNEINNLSGTINSSKAKLQYSDINTNIDNLLLSVASNNNSLSAKGKIRNLTTGDTQDFLNISGLNFGILHSSASTSLDIAANKVTAQSGDLKLGLNSAGVKGGFNTPKLKSENINPKVKVYEDKDRNIKADVTPGLKEMLKYWKVYSLVQSKSAYLYHNSYPRPIKFGDFRLRASLDSISLQQLNLSSQSNDISISGNITGIRNFLLGGSEAPTVTLNLSMDTLNLNEIAHSYESDKLKKHNSDPQNEKLSHIHELPLASRDLQGSDTTQVLLPKNLKFHLGARINDAYYTNLHFYDIGTELNIENAALNVDSLNISSDFCNAFLNFSWDTANPDNTDMRAKLEITNAELTEIYANFPSILRMAPQLNNLTGDLSLSLDASLGIFPNMYLNMPSLSAQMALSGENLTLHQTKFIRHITKMLLIRTDDDIHIPTVNIRGSAHDDLLQLYPFILEFNRYKLSMMGINDFGGNLYYHLAVLESPVPFKFGINIRGNFDSPKLRFGGSGYKVENARKELNISEHDNINMMKELRYYFSKLVRMAAVSDYKIPSQQQK